MSSRSTADQWQRNKNTLKICDSISFDYDTTYDFVLIIFIRVISQYYCDCALLWDGNRRHRRTNPRARRKSIANRALIRYFKKLRRSVRIYVYRSKRRNFASRCGFRGAARRASGNATTTSVRSDRGWLESSKTVRRTRACFFRFFTTRAIPHYYNRREWDSPREYISHVKNCSGRDFRSLLFPATRRSLSFVEEKDFSASLVVREATAAISIIPVELFQVKNTSLDTIAICLRIGEYREVRSRKAAPTCYTRLHSKRDSCIVRRATKENKKRTFSQK